MKSSQLFCQLPTPELNSFLILSAWDPPYVASGRPPQKTPLFYCYTRSLPRECVTESLPSIELFRLSGVLSQYYLSISVFKVSRKLEVPPPPHRQAHGQRCVLNAVQIVIQMFSAHTNFPVYIDSEWNFIQDINLTLLPPPPSVSCLFQHQAVLCPSTQTWGRYGPYHRENSKTSPLHCIRPQKFWESELGSPSHSEIWSIATYTSWNKVRWNSTIFQSEQRILPLAKINKYVNKQTNIITRFLSS
jgi:hypothetical protein